MAPRPTAAARGQGYNIPPPIKGLNTRDALGDMDEGFASILENWEPMQGSCRVRPGYATLIDALPDADGLFDPDGISRLCNFSGAGLAQLIAIYQSTTLRAFDSDGVLLLELPDASGATLEWAQFDNKLLFGSGLAPPVYYDGTEATGLTMLAIDGPPDVAQLNRPTVFKSRCYWVQSGSTVFWYGDTNAIQGTFTSFDLALVKPIGGQLCGIVTIARDGGAGPDDYIAFITTEGDILVYNGSDPSDAQNWALVGHYKSSPILLTADLSLGGVACVTRAGGDVVIGTVDGFISLLALTQFGADQIDKIRISSAISPDIQNLIPQFGQAGPWRLTTYAAGDWIIASCPGTPRSWYVYKPPFRAWFKLTGIDSAAIVEHASHLYFGMADGTICRLEGGTDNGASIATDYQSCWTPCRTPTTWKRFCSVRPTLTGTSGGLSYAVSSGVDFRTAAKPTPAATPSADGELWDVGQWDVAAWGGGIAQTTRRKPVTGHGYRIAVRLATLTDAPDGALHHTQIVYEPGNA